MIRFPALLCLLPLPALAEVPRVVTDIAPIHSLTAQVMGDLGTPDLLLPPGADPHDFALRPSDAARLGDADLVIWVGSGLTPWLAEPLETLAPQADVLELLQTQGWTQRDIRKSAGKSHNHGDSHSDGHDSHDDHDHKDAHAETHAHDHDDGHDHDTHDHGDGHDHGDIDPHAWLDPDVAGVWAVAIATELGRADSQNAATYAANAAKTVATLAKLADEWAAQLSGLEDRAYVLPHDGYQYFESRFGLTAQAAIAGIDARTPGPAQVAAIRDDMADNAVVCVFSDAEIGENWAALIIEGTQARTAQIDGVGRGLDAGPALYQDLLARLAADFATCLGPDA